MNNAPVGHVIRAARKKRGLTQTALAEKIGVSVSYINLIERDRRRIAGARMNAMAEALGLSPSALDGAEERRLLEDLDALSADSSLADLSLGRDTARELVSRHENWARAIVALHRASQRDQSMIAAFSDRLNHDPVLNESIHDMLNAATAILSVADIYIEAPDLPSDRRARFDGILHEEAERLATVAKSLAGFFERSEAPGTTLTAAEEVDDFLYERRNHFPALEAAMAGHFGDAPTTLALRDLLRETSGDAGSIEPPEGMPRSTERFALARRIAHNLAAQAVDVEITNADDLTSDISRQRARRALFAYAAACLLMPYERFLDAVRTTRYDIDALAMQFGASPEQLCHRFTTLRRPGAEGVPFAFLRANAAGYLTKRFPLPRFPMPRYGGACPLWAVYTAMQSPDLRQRQLVEFPNGDRFFIIARATRPAASAFGQTRPSYSLMLACDALNADKLVYADGLDLSPNAHADPVGSTCLLCPRQDCAHRQEASVRG